MHFDRLLRLRRLSSVPRWAVVPTLRRQNVAEHSFHVCTLALKIAPLHVSVQHGKLCIEDLMKAALFHDEFEALTGDIAAPTKKWMDNETLSEHTLRLGVGDHESPDIRQILKVADLLEAAVFLQEEMDMGNKPLTIVRDDLMSKLEVAWGAFNKIPPWTDTTGGFLFDFVYSRIGPEHHPAVEQVE